MPDHSQWTQEVRLVSNYDGPFNWLGGFFYFDEDFTIDTINYATLFGGEVNGLVGQRQENKSYAFYGSATYDLSDRWQLGAGIRYSHDKKDYSAERFLSPLSFLGVPPIGPI
jgi:iron complex outermembrane receptor protein